MSKAKAKSSMIVPLAMLALLFLRDAAPAQLAPTEGALQGYSWVVPLQNVSSAQIRQQVSSGSTIPMWSYSLTSPVDGLHYSGSMVGRSPFFQGARTTQIPTILVPLIIQMPDGGVFDPTQPDSTCLAGKVPLTLVQQSPLLNNANYTLGSTFVGDTQYIDAFQRANFWNTNVSTTGDRYHALLGPVTTLSPVTVIIPTGFGATYTSSTFGGCGTFGVMDFSTFDGIVRNTVIPTLAASGVGPTVLPLFVMYNVVEGNPGDSPNSNCCILGYHGAYSFPVQTYSPFDFDSTRIFHNTGSTSVMSHEVGEWMNDPLGTNPTPLWGHIGQVAGCQNNLEVGDPLSGTLFPAITMSNGFTYDLQELAFFSWFYRQSPSLGINGWFSNAGKFITDAGPVC